jgi:cell division GTPase FtsZ
VPPPSRQDKFALRVGALGLGQAGGNLVTEFHRRGYRAMAINTASTDLRALGQGDGLPEDARLYVGLEGSDGAGKDPDYGKACLLHHASRIVEDVQARFSDVDILMLCAGLGGGTGSNIGELYRLLEPTGLPLAACVTLPAPHESALVKVNAVKAAQQLVDVKLHARMMVDNARLEAMFPDVDVLSYYPTANAAIVDALDEFNRLNSRMELRSIRSFDGEDLRKVLLSGGVVVPSISGVKETSLTARDLEAHVSAAVDGGHVFAHGLSMSKVNLLAVVLVAPEEVLRETRSAALDELEANLKARTGGGAVYTGLYATTGKEATLMVLASSQSLPGTVEELLTAARKEGQVLSQKIHEDLPPLDVTSVTGLNLSRAPAPAALSRPPSIAPASSPPRPRPVQSQLPPPEPQPAPPPSAAQRAPLRPPEPPAHQNLPRAAPEPAGDRPPTRPPEPLITRRGENPPPVQGTSPSPARQFTDPAATGMEDAPGPIPPRPPLGSRPNVPTALVPALTDEVSIPGTHGSQEETDHLQAFYEDLAERFRQAPDRKARERVARRLIEDSRSDDEDIRALAVWAMVALNERGFRRALFHAVKDSSSEVRRLAKEGLERLGVSDGGPDGE